jgi:hypothetical protein
MQFKAKVIQIMPIEKGTSKAGWVWSIQNILTETDGQYPKKVELTLFADMVGKFKVGQICNFHIDIESKKSTTGDRYFTSVKCWKFDTIGGALENGETVTNGTPDLIDSNQLPF